MKGRTPVAGIGNIFLGDDGFSVEVVSKLAKGKLPGMRLTALLVGAAAAVAAAYVVVTQLPDIKRYMEMCSM